MLTDYFTLMIIGMAAAAIGAAPFGLVNLTVLNASIEGNNRAAFRISHGASVVEVLFGLLAIFGGSMVYQLIEGNTIVSFVSMGILIAGGVFFLLKKPESYSIRKTSKKGFWKGVLLNLISVQVLLYWILAITYLSSRQLIQFDFLSVILFLIGIWLGKITVLWLYINLSVKMLSRSRIFSNNTNKIIGLVLFGMAILQIFRM